MPRTYSVRNLAIRMSTYEGLVKKKNLDGYLGSLTAFASEVLEGFIKGSLVKEDLLRAKIEAEITARLAGRPARAEFMGLEEKKRGKRNAA